MVVGGAEPVSPCWDPIALGQELAALVAGGLSRREAARTLAERSGHSRRELYALLHSDPGTVPPDPEADP